MKTLFAARLNQHPWHITPAGAQELRVLSEMEITLDDFLCPRQPMRSLNGVALINVTGILAAGMPPIWEKTGNTDYRTLAAEIAAAAGDANIRAVLLNVESPGGNCIGCTEIFDAIFALAARKPVIAYTSGAMCSAAYYISSAASFIYASKTAAVGSIGTIVTLFDMSEGLAQNGVRVIQVASGDLKGGSSTAGYSEAQLADVQRTVGDYFAAFSADVRKKRTISDDAMRGQWFKADAAPQGLVDFIGVPAIAARDALALASGGQVSPPVEAYAGFFTPAAKELSGGRWVTVEGEHIYVKGGSVVAGHVPGGGGNSYKHDEKSVGSHVHVKAEGDTAEKIHAGFEAIHSVHGNGGLGGKIEADARVDDKGAVGQFERDKHTHVARQIGVKESGKHKAFTAVHEAGHFIDNGILETGGDFASAGEHDGYIKSLKKSFDARRAAGEKINPEDEKHLAVHEAVADLKNTLAKTAEVKKLKRLKAVGEVGAKVKEAQKDHEIFARAYSQHIATKSQHPELLAGLNADRTSQMGKFMSTHWSDESFKPVSEKFDALFKAKGWHKES